MINSVTLLGRLVAAPELKKTNNGLSVVRFRIAVDRDFSKDGTADFINCTAWRETAEFIEKYFGKGSMIALLGSIRTGTYEDKDGNKRNTFEVLVGRASFCGGKKEDAAPGENNSAIDINVDDDDDDLPWN